MTSFASSEPGRQDEGGLSAEGRPARRQILSAALHLLIVVALVLAVPFPAAAEEANPLSGVRSVVESVPFGYELVATSTHLSLYIDESNGHLAVLDRRAGRVWLTTPELPSNVDIARNVLRTLQTDFTLIMTGGAGTQTKRTDSVTDVSKLTIERLPAGAEASYAMDEFGAGLTLRYEIGPDYLDVTLAEAKLEETESSRFVALDLFPLLGAVPFRADTSAYVILPDGPGALLRLGGEHPAFRKQTSLSAYGATVYSFAQPPTQRTSLAALGIVHPDDRVAVLAVATQGAADTVIEASLARRPTMLSQAKLRLVYRNLTEYPSDQQDVFKGFYEAERILGDRAVRYFFLADEGADWVGMAQRLRRHFVEDLGIPRLSGESAQPAMRLRLVMGAAKPGLFGRRFLTATTFDEAGEIVSQFHQRGIKNLDVVLVGWSTGGYEGRLPRRWPPDRRLGGANGLRRLADRVEELGGRLLLEDDYTLAFLRNGGFFPPTDAVILPNLLPMTDMIASASRLYVPPALRRNQFFLNPVFALDRYVMNDVPRLAALGVDGLELRWAGELVLKDANPRHPLERTEFGQAWRQMLGTIRDKTGSAAAQGGNAYVLGAVDAVTNLPLDRNDYTFGEQTVPFYPVATHGLVRLYGEPSNLDQWPERDALRRLEYGMSPAYEFTYRDPVLLARSTYSELYTSQYENWIDRAATEYERLVIQLGHTVGQFIIAHRQLGPDVYEIEYEDGTRVAVNYSESPFEQAGLTIEPMGYSIR